VNTVGPVDLWQFEEALGELGFVREGGAYRLDRIRLTADGHWLTLETEGAGGSNDPLDCSGLVGLWKPAGEGDGLRRRFELPFSAIGGGRPGPSGETGSDLAEAVQWALATVDGDVPSGWAPPSPRQPHLIDGDLVITAEQGRLVRRGRASLGPDKLVLRVPIVARAAADLDEARRAWLRELLVDAQGRWRMVRIHMSEGVTAEIDLTGAPHQLVETLVEAGRAILRGVGQWLVGPADLIADDSIVSKALQIRPSRVSSTRERS